MIYINIFRIKIIYFKIHFKHKKYIKFRMEFKNKKITHPTLKK